ncbi:Dehydrin, conserved site [Sesbania bispinosa]|nr:Dehydrin, conserved site [Sesbania bispinosa]
MAHYQNQYGAVPASGISKNPIQNEMDTTGDTTGIGVGVGGGTQQVIADEYGRTTNMDAVDGTGGVGVGEHHHHHKKGIIEKIKEKLPGTGTHHNN